MNPALMSVHRRAAASGIVLCPRSFRCQQVVPRSRVDVLSNVNVFLFT